MLSEIPLMQPTLKTRTSHSVQSLKDQLTEILQHKTTINTVHELLNSDLISGKNLTEIVDLLNFRKSKKI
jgi:hypothetical protein